MMSNYFIVTLIFSAALARCNEKPAEANPKMAAFLRKILEKPQSSKNNQLADAPHPIDGTLYMNIDSITPSSSDDKNTANEALKNLSNLRSIRQGKKVLGYYALISCLECHPPKITTALYDVHKRLVGQLYESHSARVTITDENFSVEKTQQLMQEMNSTDHQEVRTITNGNKRVGYYKTLNVNYSTQEYSLYDDKKQWLGNFKEARVKTFDHNQWQPGNQRL